LVPPQESLLKWQKKNQAVIFENTVEYNIFLKLEKTHCSLFKKTTTSVSDYKHAVYNIVRAGPLILLYTRLQGQDDGYNMIAKYNIVTAYREVVVKNLENIIPSTADACEILYDRVCAVFLFAVSGTRSFRTPTTETARKFCYYYFHLALYYTMHARIIRNIIYIYIHILCTCT